MKSLYINNLLPESCYVEVLKNWSIVLISGQDSTTYLQNQTTFNILNLQDNEHIICAHCNVNGKVQGVFRLFKFQLGYVCIQRKSICDLQIEEFKKYSVFYNVKINELNDYVLIGIMGNQSDQLLSKYYNYLLSYKSSMLNIKNIIILQINQNQKRFLLMVSKKILLDFKNFLFNNKLSLVQDKWLLFEIIAGVPILERQTFKKFFPNEINLNELYVIDYQKGCYLGQEIISKMFFKGIKKNKLCNLIGICYNNINIFSVVECYTNKKWIKCGYTLSYCKLFYNTILVQCVLKIKQIQSERFRIVVQENNQIINLYYIL